VVSNWRRNAESTSSPGKVCERAGGLVRPAIDEDPAEFAEPKLSATLGEHAVVQPAHRDAPLVAVPVTDTGRRYEDH
jgi:hypothetical protein